jgi:uncharacterized membrane protein
MKADVLITQAIASALLGFYFWFSQRRGWGGRITLSDRAASAAVITAAALYFLIFSLLTSFRYLSLTPAAMDLGVFENTLWRVSHGELARLLESYTHTMPILAIPALFYRAFPHPFTMLILQSGALALAGYLAFRLARMHLEPFPATVLGLAFLLHPGTSWLNLFDFHPECFWPALFFGAAWALERKRPWVFLVLGVLLVLVKEPLALSAAALGVYALWTGKARWQGAILILAGTGAFFLSVLWLIPSLMEAPYPYYEAYGGLNLQFVPAKLVYIINILGPYAFTPLASPIELLPALPHALASLASANPTHFSIRYQYSASLVPPLIYALVFVTKRAKSPPSFGLGILVCSALFHIFVSASPLSYEFWAKPRSGFHFSRYIPDQRDREVMAFLGNAVPKDPRVSVCVSDQQGVYCSVIGKRWKMRIFPHGIGECDIVVVDTAGETLLWKDFYPVKDSAAFQAELSRVRELYEPAGACRGVVVYKRR